jgi:hypothetical protein
MIQFLFSDFSFRKGIGKEKLMYIANRRLWILPTLAIAMLLVATAIFTFSSAAMAQTAAGDYCVEGIVIDWEEQPMGGITVNLETPNGLAVPQVSKTDEDEEGEFEFKSEDGDFIGAPGTYTATVTLPGPDWEGVTPTTIVFDISAGEDDCVRIRFKLRQIVPVTVYKIDADHVPLVNWTIDAIPGGGNLFAEPQSEDTNIDGYVTFTLTPGSWVFMERQPEPSEQGQQPDAYRPVVPKTGRMELDVQPLEPGDPPYILVFKNEFVDNGCIIVRKFGVCETVDGGTGIMQNGFCVDTGSGSTGYGAAGWGFQLLRSDDTIARQGVTDAEGYLVFDHLPYGPYTIVEEDRPGWDEVTERKLDVTIDSGECFVQTFENVQDDSGYCIEGYKYDANGMYGLPGWKIETDPVDDGGYEPDDVYTDGLGKYTINFPGDDYRIPGAEFEVCEDEDEMDGWLPHTPTCQIVKLPKQPGACVQALDFINQQVGHSEYEAMQKEMGSMKGQGGDMWMGGGNMDGGMGMNCSTYHKVMPGEGLFDIGYDYSVSPQAMVNANPSVSAPSYTIYVGQSLCIP